MKSQYGKVGLGIDKGFELVVVVYGGCPRLLHSSTKSMYVNRVCYLGESWSQIIPYWRQGTSLMNNPRSKRTCLFIARKNTTIVTV